VEQREEERAIEEAAAGAGVDPRELTDTLRRIGEACFGVRSAFTGFSETLRRAAALTTDHPAYDESERSRRDALGRASGHMMCYHPHQNIRAEAHRIVLSCPECGASAMGPSGSGLTLAPREFSMRPVEPPPEQGSVSVQAVAQIYGLPERILEHPVTQDSPGLGAVGRNVPEHRPGSWLSGRPWDDRPSPARDVLPERKPDTTPEQRLREAADRIRNGLI
jgi:hypothetical protein